MLIQAHRLSSAFVALSLTLAFSVGLTACHSNGTAAPASVSPVTAKAAPASSSDDELQTDEDGHQHEKVDFETCEKTVAHLPYESDLDLLNSCIEWYWHNGGADLGWKKIIKIGYRIVDVDPQQTQTYTVIAWLLWSKWVTWDKDHAQMPDGEKKVEEALALLYRGRAANPEDADYHNDCGNTMAPLAQFHRPEVWPFVTESFRLADRYAATNQLRLRARISLGHAYRRQKMWNEALTAYSTALAIDPNNRTSLLNSGLALRNLHRYREALQAYGQVLAKLPNYTFALLGRGDTYFDMGEKDNATANYLAAAASDPKNTDAAVGLRKVGRYADASKIYEKILTDNPKDLAGLLGRAHILRETGKKAEAIAAYKAVLKVYGKNEEAIHYLKELEKPDGSLIEEFQSSASSEESSELELQTN